MATKKNKKVIQIEIDKNKIIKTVLLFLFIVIICLICFFASSKNATPYSDKSTSSESQLQNDIFEQATKDAAEVSDDERTKPKEISINDYISLYEGDVDSVILISKPTCDYCKIATPILENIIYESKVAINYLNADNLSEDDVNTLISSDDYFAKGYGTPLLLIVGHNSIKDKVEGLVSKESYEVFFKEYGFME